MKVKTKSIITVIIIVVFVSSNVGSYIAGKYTKKDIIKIITKTEIKTKTVYRDYPKMKCSKVMEELKKYDQGDFLLDGRMISDNIFRAEATLYQRHAERDFILKAKAKNDTIIRNEILLFFGGMIIGGFLGGMTDYKITERLSK